MSNLKECFDSSIPLAPIEILFWGIRDSEEDLLCAFFADPFSTSSSSGDSVSSNPPFPVKLALRVDLPDLLKSLIILKKHYVRFILPAQSPYCYL